MRGIDARGVGGGRRRINAKSQRRSLVTARAFNLQRPCRAAVRTRQVAGRAHRPSIGPAPARPHVQTLVGGPAAPAPAAAPAPPPAPAPAAAPAAAAAAATAGNGEFAERLAGLGLSKEQVDGVLSLSREVVEQIVWEVVPTLAETIIKEEIRRLTAE